MLMALATLALQQGTNQVFEIHGAKRSALVFSGAGTPPKAGFPLVLAFHGHGGTAVSAARKLGLNRLWPEAIVVYPQGLDTATGRDPDGSRPGWQNGPGMEGDRDVKFVDAILGRLKGYDPRRTFAMGFSNGGGFVYTLWATRPDRFVAFAPGGAVGGRSLRLLKPAPAFVTVGEQDPTSERQKQTLARIASLDGVDLASARRTGPLTLAKGRSGIAFGSYVHPGGHDFPPAAAQATIAFFKALPSR